MNIRPELIQQFSPDIDFIFWPSTEELNWKLKEAASVDYLLDGLLYQYLQNETNPRDEVSFIHEHFGKKLVVYFKTGPLDSVDDVLKLGQTFFKEKAKLLVLNPELLSPPLLKKLS